ncbi:hypothetical protein ACRYCC_35225 [Actinomadura scrupuli]|uniref:hypothetical protein n=1 Tax=Actinomadura scrupuli TaxID=559629 RepID=UPI003D987300
MDAEQPKLPAWAKGVPSPWIDLQDLLPWLKPRPYLVDQSRTPELQAKLAGAGFHIVEVHYNHSEAPPEQVFLIELTKKLEFPQSGAGGWAAFNDRLWDFLTSGDRTAVAVLIMGLDTLLGEDVYSFTRCVHNLLSLTEGAGLSDSAADRQIEYFFVGSWHSDGGVSAG